MKRIFLSLAALCITALILCGCTSGRGGKYNFDDGENSKNAVLSDISEYTIVRGDSCSDEETEAFVTFNETVKKNLSLTLSVTTDWVKAKEKEILIGATNRAESRKALDGMGYNDYVIKMDGKKLIIAGGSGKATKAAVEYFIENYINIYNATLSYPKEAYKHEGSLILSSLTIDGAPISEYKLYAADSEIDLGDVKETLASGIVGAELSIAESMSSYEKYVIFCRTGLMASEYGINLEENGNLVIYGSYDTFDRAKEYFKNEYFSELAAKKQTTDVDITWHDNVKKNAEKKSIYTKDALLSLLSDTYKDPDALLFGELLGGSGATPSYTIKRFSDLTGENPALIGIDLGCHGLNLGEIAAEEWSMIICQLVDYAANGGIVTATAHFENPTGNWLLGDKSLGVLGGEDKWEELLTEGSNLNLKFKEELSMCGVFLKALGDNGVPVLWNPLSESNGDDYWFSASGNGERIDGEYLKRLWIYIYEYFNELGLKNLIWVYSPAVFEGEDTLPFDYCYPGDDYVDIIGCSVKMSGKNGILSDKGGFEFALEREKPFAICSLELNSGSGLVASTRDEQKGLYSTKELLDDIYSLIGKGYKISYIMTESGTSSIYWLGNENALIEDEMILTQKDIAK